MSDVKLEIPKSQYLQEVIEWATSTVLTLDAERQRLDTENQRLKRRLAKYERTELPTRTG